MMRRFLGAIFLVASAAAQQPQMIAQFTVSEPARAVVLAPGGKHIVVAVSRKKATLFDVATKSKMRDLETAENVSAADFSPDGMFLGLATQPGAFQVRNVADGKVVQEGASTNDTINRLCFSPDHMRVALGGESGAIRIVDVKSGKSVGPFAPTLGATWGMTFAPDGMLATADEDTNVRFWDHNGKLTRQWEYSLVAPFAVSFSNDGKMLAVGGAAKSVKIVDVASGKAIKEFSTGRFVVRTIVLSPDAHFAAVQTMDQDGFGLPAPLQIWDIVAGKKVFEMPSGISTSMTFDAKSNLLVAKTKDNSAQLWSVTLK
jgi:WD40 repeat protein